MKNDDKNNSPDKFLEIQSVKDECAFDPKSERVVIVGTTPLGISPAFDQLNWKEDPYRHIAMVSQADIDENLESFFKRTEGTKIDNLLKDDKVKFMEHLSTPIKPNLEAMAAVAEVTADLPGAISRMRDIDLQMKNNQEKAIMDIIHNAKISAMKDLLNPEYFKELETSLRESKIPLDPLPKSMNDFLKGGVPVGQMLCISGPNFAHNEAFMKLANNSIGRSYKTNILETLMFNSMPEGEKILFDEIDVTERFKEKIALSMDSLSMVDMGRRNGKSMLSLQAVEEIVETIRNLHPCTKQKEFILTEVPDHKSKSYYDRKPKYDPKPSPLLMGLIKKPGA